MVASRTILAIVLSIIVLILYDKFIMKPKIEKLKKEKLEETKLEKDKKPETGREQKEKGKKLKLSKLNLGDLSTSESVTSPFSLENSMVLFGVNKTDASLAVLKNFAEKVGSEKRLEFRNNFFTVILFKDDEKFVPKEIIDGINFKLSDEDISLSGKWTISDKNYLLTLSTIVQNSSQRNIESSFLVVLKNIFEKAGRFVISGNKFKKINKKSSDYNISHIGFDSQYFSYAVILKSPVEFNSESEDDAIILQSGKFIITPGGKETFEFSIFIGPKVESNLRSADEELVRLADMGWLGPLARVVIVSLKYIQKLVINWGLAIIILSVIVKILLTPLNSMSLKSMKRMKELQPKVEEIKQKYKDDKQKLSQEIMELYKREKINPFSGCLPMLLQIPIFFALYRGLMSAIELRHAKFFLWINDLSSPDRLFTIDMGTFSLPFRVLPMVMGGTFLIQQLLSPQTSSETKFLNWLMPVMFTFILWNLPSGLHLYWITINILSIVQQYYTLKKNS